MISKQVILKWFLTPLMLLGLSIASLAQNIQIKGKVIDAETKQALEAATVLVKDKASLFVQMQMVFFQSIMYQLMLLL